MGLRGAGFDDFAVRNPPRRFASTMWHLLTDCPTN